MSPFVVGPGTFNPRGKIVVFSKSDSEARTQPETDAPGQGFDFCLAASLVYGAPPWSPCCVQRWCGALGHGLEGGGSLLMGTGCGDSCHWRSYHSVVVSLTLTCMRPLPS